ncbi:MAG: hypothetical protein ACHQCH_05585 [Solirubrobacterales bacterium]
MTESTERVTTAELLDLAKSSVATARTLEYWRQEGLLPKAKRTGQTGKRPEWTYPAEAADQLTALLRLREKTKQPDVLRVALWFEGFPIDTVRVRASIAAELRRLHEFVTNEVDEHRGRSAAGEGSTWVALEEIGRLWARKRGSNAPPRYGRQTLDDRARAMTLILGLALGDNGASSRLEEDAHRVEWLIGADRGRHSRAGLPTLLKGTPGEGLADFASFASLPALIETIESATEDEVAASRMLARLMLDGITGFARIVDAFTVIENVFGLAAMETFRDDPNAAVWLTAFVIAVGRSRELSENLRSLLDALSRDVLPVAERARELAVLSAEDLHQQLPALENLPFIERVRIQGLISKYRDEQPHVEPSH